MAKSELSGKHARREVAERAGLIDGSHVMITFSPEVVRRFRELEEAIRLKLPEITKAFPRDELLAYDLVRDCGSGHPVTLSDALWKLPSISSYIKEYTEKTGDHELDHLYNNIENELMERGSAFLMVERQRSAHK